MTKPRFHYLGRAVVRFEGKILLAHLKGGDNTFLPGGHIEFGESIPHGIIRELMEEVGLPAQIESYIGAVEHTWKERDVSYFEINHVFSVTIPSLKQFSDISSQEDHIEFIWADPEELSVLNLQPHPLISLLKKPIPADAPPFWASTLNR